jgi:hypothetical protein
MTTYVKNLHGDPKSPVNGRLRGLFFSASVDMKTGLPPQTSIYGEQRILISSMRILRWNPNVYFTDFYCVNKAHYVTLVLAKPGTPSDIFCATHLIRINLYVDNGICVVDTRSGYLEFLVTTGVWVHIMITDDIDIDLELYHGAMFHAVNMIGTSRIIHGIRVGRRKNSNCAICNI